MYLTRLSVGFACAFSLICQAHALEAEVDKCKVDLEAELVAAQDDHSGCEREATDEYDQCLADGWPFWLRKNCSKFYDIHRKQCTTIFNQRRSLALKKYFDCKNPQLAREPKSVVILPDTQDIPKLPVLLAGGTTFKKAGDALATEYSQAIVVSIPHANTELAYDNMVDAVTAGVDTLPGPVSTFAIIDHGGDFNDDGHTDQHFGDDALIEERLEQVITLINTTTADGALVLLTGCNVGSNTELCQCIADKTGNVVMACPKLTKYEAPSRNIGNLDEFTVFIPQ